MDNVLTKGKQVGISKEGVHQKDEIDVKKLEHELKKLVSGDVRFDDGALALYATDSSNYRQVPVGIVTPKNEEDIINYHQHFRVNTNRRSCRVVGGTSLSRARL